ncbi:LysR family transcriptional regulator [Ovoidimarina sediminis]|uniref:LysR family transcriptional regulator n=1 Tax=Ovoidimarina sediminis TaxID=3079856 RepID=UPI00290D5803|nr:LysR substrate-binding domain-containing protein [Rhodophyticola sp. MJ-SS7]MDU8941819.1 LysR substrate-binding domain-containing protein [Rhodophyticola sp. MJ-SS7]
MELDLTRLNLRHLRLIHGIGETGQISLAAERMGISQPAASRSLSDIERLIGAPLFERRVRGMVPTRIGELFLHHLDTIVGELVGTIESLDAFQKGRAGGVRIGSVTGPAIGSVVPAVQALQREAPMAEISIDVAPSRELVNGLIRGDYDIVLGRIPPETDPRQFDIRRGRTEEVRLVVRAGHPLLDRGPVGLSALREFVWVTQGTGSPIRSTVEKAFLMASLPPPARVLVTASLVVTASYIRNSDAIASVTAEVSDLIVSATGSPLLELPLAESIVLDPYHLLAAKNRGLTPIGLRMQELLAEHLGAV